MRAGRDCPLDYRLPEDSFLGEPLFDCEALYVVGGLYGNRQALGALEKRLAAEPGAKAVFNGDAHWFDRSPEVFADIEKRLSAHLVLRGNVETELGRADASAGCGCGYPDEVDEQTVEWSNSIHAQLLKTVHGLEGMAASLAARPPTALVSVGGKHIAITHGDEQSLAGWGCARAALAQASRQQALAQWSATRGIAVLATSHTCAPAALTLDRCAVVNNGAAGMPNFDNGRYGLVSRIALKPHPAALYRAKLAGLIIEALPLGYDHQAFVQEFDRQWPADSPAALSYRPRLLDGTLHSPHSALLAGFSLSQTLCALEGID